MCRSFPSEGDGGGVANKVFVEVDTASFDGGASLLEDVVEDVEAVVGIVLVAILSVGPARISAVIDVSDILGKSVDGEDVTTLDEGIVEWDLREEAAEEILQLNLTSGDLPARLSEYIKSITVEEAVRVGVVEGEPHGDKFEWHDVQVEAGVLETHEVDVDANVGIWPERELDPVVNNEGSIEIFSNIVLIGFNGVAEVEIVVSGDVECLSGFSIEKNRDLLRDTDKSSLVGCSRSEGSESGEKDLSHINFFIIKYIFF